MSKPNADEPREERLTAYGLQMKARIEEAQRRGESDGTLAARYGLKAGTITWWRSRLRRVALSERAAGAADAARFVAVELSSSVPAVATSASESPFARAFIVELDGVRVSIPSGFDAAEVRRLIGALRAC